MCPRTPRLVVHAAPTSYDGECTMFGMLVASGLRRWTRLVAPRRDGVLASLRFGFVCNNERGAPLSEWMYIPRQGRSRSLSSQEWKAVRTKLARCDRIDNVTYQTGGHVESNGLADELTRRTSAKR